MKLLLSLLLVVAGPFLLSAQPVREPRITNPDWTRELQPFRIAGNLYYVGTADLGCYFLATAKGGILINTGVSSSATSIGKSLAQLGFRLSDIRILLTTQVHYDHVGAMAALKSRSGAKLMVDAADADVMEDGGLSDYEFGGKNRLFAPARVDRRLRDGDTISFGGTEIRMLHHPGHTKGSCSYLVTVHDSAREYSVLIANMPTIVTEKPLSQVPAYPGIAADYAYTLQAMRGLRFDLWVASHASQFDLEKKRKPGAAYNPAAFGSRSEYEASLAELEKSFAEKRN